MWKTFIAEVKYILGNKWRVAGWLFMLLIPLAYGFLYMNAYWSPFKHVDSLKIVVVNQDKSSKDKANSEYLTKSILDKKSITVAGEIYELNIIQDTEIANHPKEAVQSGKYAAAIIIPDGYSDSINHKRDRIKAAGTQPGGITIHGLVNVLEGKEVDGSPLKSGEKEVNNIVFYNSYKNNYLAGEMTNFGAGLTSLALKAMFPLDNSSPVVSGIHNMLSQMSSDVELIQHEKIAPEINTYGKGLSPYFISIALWAGALVMTFIFKNERHIKDQGTLKHLSGKYIAWLLSGWLQTTILLSAIWLQGIDLGMSQWKLYFLGYFVSAIFTMCVMAVAYSFRFGDIGEFTVVILLIIQLISSSGTFPVEMQIWLFKIFHPIVPFTYSVSLFREVLYMPDNIEVVKNMGILLIFPAIFLPVSYFFNRRFDLKNKQTLDGVEVFKSYEIHLGDL